MTKPHLPDNITRTGNVKLLRCRCRKILRDQLILGDDQLGQKQKLIIVLIIVEPLYGQHVLQRLGK